MLKYFKSKKKPRLEVAIIGTTGRSKEDLSKLDAETFEKMCQKCEEIVISMMKNNEINENSKLTFVSGGSSWSDHVAIRMYLKFFDSKLILHLPCKFSDNLFDDNGLLDWKLNPGYRLNLYHETFTKKVGYDTLKELQFAADSSGVKMHVHGGFFERNNEIAKVSNLIAFSFSDDIPSSRGTLYTWKKSAATRKININISKLT